MRRRDSAYRDKQRQRDLELNKLKKRKLQEVLKTMYSGLTGLSSYQQAVKQVEMEERERKRRESMRAFFSPDYRKKEVKKKQRKQRNQRKRELLNDKLSLLNIDRVYPDYKLEGIKLDELNQDTFIDKHEFILGFDVTKRVTLSEYIMLGYRDYSYNAALEDIISFVREKTTYQLLLDLRDIALRPLTGLSGVKNSSSGRAGGGLILKGSYDELYQVRQEQYDSNRGLRRFVKSWERIHFVPYRFRQDEHIGMQFIRVGGRSIFNEVSFRELLIYTNAVLWNITEIERVDFYLKFYELIEEEFPQLLYLLPDASGVM